MSDKRGSWHLLTGAIIGILIGLVIAYVVLPVRYMDTEPYSLKPADREIYRGLIAKSFQVEADTPRALARLALLRDLNPASALVEQAQQQLAINGEDTEARSLALLAAAVSQPSVRITAIPLYLSSPIPVATATSTIPAAPTLMQQTPTPFITITPRPSPTVQPTLGAPFSLVDQVVVCEPDQKDSLIQVYVLDMDGEPVSGVKIEVSLPGGGTEAFYTGFHPEISPGYADYSMLPGMIYNLRVGTEGLPVQNLSIPNCEDDQGKSFPGSLRLNYQQAE